MHFTVTVDGHVKIGPTAGPAWWFENYGATDPDVASGRFAWGELGSIVREHMRLFFMQPCLGATPYESHAEASVAPCSRRPVARSRYRPQQVHPVGTLGLRAQLVDQNQAEL